MDHNEQKAKWWTLACLLGVASIVLPFLFILLKIEFLAPSAILALIIFTFVASVGSFISNERKKYLSLFGVLFSLTLPSIILIEPYLPNTIEMNYIDPNSGNNIRIVQIGKDRTIYMKERIDGAEWVEISEVQSQKQNGKVEP